MAAKQDKALCHSKYKIMIQELEKNDTVIETGQDLKCVLEVQRTAVTVHCGSITMECNILLA